MTRDELFEKLDKSTLSEIERQLVLEAFDSAGAEAAMNLFNALAN